MARRGAARPLGLSASAVAADNVHRSQRGGSTPPSSPAGPVSGLRHAADVFEPALTTDKPVWLTYDGERFPAQLLAWRWADHGDGGWWGRVIFERDYGDGPRRQDWWMPVKRLTPR